MTFPRNVWRIPFTKTVFQWYGWRSLIGAIAYNIGLFSSPSPWFLKGPLWNWCFRSKEKPFDWRAERRRMREYLRAHPDGWMRRYMGMSGWFVENSTSAGE